MPIKVFVLGGGILGFAYTGAEGEVPILFLWARGFFLNQFMDFPGQPH